MRIINNDGLSFYPIYIDEYDSDLRLIILEKYGPLGYDIYRKLECMIFKDGYFMLRQLRNVIMLINGEYSLFEFAPTAEKTKEIILFLIDIGAFDKELFKDNVYTNRKIQLAYSQVAVKTKGRALIKDYSLLTPEENKEFNFLKYGKRKSKSSANEEENIKDKVKESKAEESTAELKDSKTTVNNSKENSTQENIYHSLSDLFDKSKEDDDDLPF